MQKILILEDDENLAKTLLAGLASAELEVEVVHTLDDFYHQAEHQLIDVCIMDRMIGHEDSAASLEYIREILPQAKILFLSKKSAINERIRGLAAGADDYLPKPFSLAELKLRVNSLLRFQRVVDQQSVKLGLVNFYPASGIIQTPEKEVVLRRRENQIVSCLARNMGAVVSRQMLSQELWPESYEPNPNTIDVYIRRLRQKLGKYRSILKTRRGFGYRLVSYERK